MISPPVCSVWQRRQALTPGSLPCSDLPASISARVSSWQARQCGDIAPPPTPVWQASQSRSAWRRAPWWASPSLSRDSGPGMAMLPSDSHQAPAMAPIATSAATSASGLTNGSRGRELI